MSNFDALFPDGQSVSAFVKGTQRVFEGEIYTRDDGSRVVLSESGKFKRLSELERIVRVGELLREQNEEAVTSMIDGILKEIDPKKAENKDDELTQAVSSVVEGSDEGKKSGLKPEEIQQKIPERWMNIKMEAEGGPSGGDAQRAQNVIDNMKKKEAEGEQLTESIKSTLREALPDTLLDALGGEVEPTVTEEDPEVDELFKDIDPALDSEVVATEDEAFDYIDPDYCNVSDETAETAIQDVIDNVIESSADDVVEYLAKNYELSEDDAQLLASRAFDKYLASCDLGDYDENDAVDEEFESAIDEYDGDDDGLLDYLTDTFEIPEGEATRILHECKFNRSRAILEMAEYVRHTLR